MMPVICLKRNFRLLYKFLGGIIFDDEKIRVVLFSRANINPPKTNIIITLQQKSTTKMVEYCFLMN